MTPNEAVYPASPPPPAGSPSSGNRSRQAHKQSTVLLPCHTRLPQRRFRFESIPSPHRRESRPRPFATVLRLHEPCGVQCGRERSSPPTTTAANSFNPRTGPAPNTSRFGYFIPRLPEKIPKKLRFIIHCTRIGLYVCLQKPICCTGSDRQARRRTDRQPALHTRKDASPYNGNACPEHPSRQNPNAQNL